MKLVTVVFENVLKEKISALVEDVGASGFTITRTEGQGSRGVRASEFEGPNLKLQTIVDSEVADRLFALLAENYFEDYAVIAWECDVGVMRGEKFRGSSH